MKVLERRAQRLPESGTRVPERGVTLLTIDNSTSRRNIPGARVRGSGRRVSR